MGGDLIVRQTLFDSYLNVKNEYFALNESKFGIKYDHSDLFDVIQAQTASLSHPIDILSKEFQMFHEYLMPSYDDMINATKFRFHEIYL